MYNTQEIAKRIKNINKTRNESLGVMLSKLEMGINTVSELGKGKQISYLNFAKIADYLNVSVDYLLGRTDEPKTISGHSIKIEEIYGDHSANVNIGETIDRETLEIAQMIKKLSIVERAEIILKVNEMINQNKE